MSIGNDGIRNMAPLGTGQWIPDMVDPPDWSKGLYSHEDPFLHDAGKVIGGTGAVIGIGIGAPKVFGPLIRWGRCKGINVPTNLGPFGSKAPRQVTPGVRMREGHYIDDLGRSQPWRAHYDQYGRQFGRTDYNAGNLKADIPDVHYHRIEYSPQFPHGRPVLDHIPGEFPQ